MPDYKQENFYTFKNIEKVQRKIDMDCPNSKERLKRANDYIHSLRLSNSPDKVAKSSDFAFQTDQFQTQGNESLSNF